jgi:hypothetical protein
MRETLELLYEVKDRIATLTLWALGEAQRDPEVNR